MTVYNFILRKPNKEHCVKSVQIQSFLWSVFFCIRTEYGVWIFLYSVRIQKNMDQKKLRIWTLFMQWEISP